MPTTSGAVATNAIIAGTYEIGKGSAIGVLNAYLKGLPIRIIGNGPMWDERTPFSMMIVASEFAGQERRILQRENAVLAGDSSDLNDLAMSAWIDQNGGDSKSISWVEVPNSAGGAAVGEHRCAGWRCCKSRSSAARCQTGAVRAFAPAYNAIAPHFSTALYFVQADWAAKNGATIKAFLDATYAAAKATNGRPSETAAMMSRRDQNSA